MARDDVQPGEPPSVTRRRTLQTALTLGIGLFAILFFFQTRDPMFLVGGAFLVTVLLYLFRRYDAAEAQARPGPTLSWSPAPPPAQVVKVRCMACQALNDEAARYCSACGKPLGGGH